MIWLPIPDHPGYDVNDEGDIRSFRRTPDGHLLKPCTTASGHRMVMLGRGAHMFVHTAVLLAFVGPRPEGHEALHLNGDPSHNFLTNLRWGTRGENTLMDKWHGKVRANYRLTVEAVRDIKQNARELGYDVMMSRYGVSRSTISDVVTGRFHKDVTL